jgi:hypothetical protein
MTYRLIEKKDYKIVSELIARAMENSDFAKFYPSLSIEAVKESLDEKGVEKRASWTHFYVIEEDNDNGGSLVVGPSVVDKNKDDRSFFQKLWDKATKKEVENAKEEEKLSQLFNNRYGLLPIFGEEELLRSLGIFDDEEYDDDLLG